MKNNGTDQSEHVTFGASEIDGFKAVTKRWLIFYYKDSYRTVHATFGL